MKTTKDTRFVPELYVYKKTEKILINTQRPFIVYEAMHVSDYSTIQEKYLKSKGVENNQMNPTIRSKIAFGIAAIMKKFHQQNVIFGDLTLDSIYLDNNLEPKIKIEPSYRANHQYEDIDINIGCQCYMAPEIFMGEDEYGKEVDVYSYAIILYKMFSNTLQLNDKRPIRSSQQYLMRISKGNRPVRPESIPDPYWDLIQRCWNHKPKLRPTFDQITKILKDDSYAIEEFGMRTDLDNLQEYQSRIDDDDEIYSEIINRKYSFLNRKTSFDWSRH